MFSVSKRARRAFLLTKSRDLVNSIIKMPATIIDRQQLKIASTAPKLKSNELYRLFLASLELSDSLENIFEEKGEYDKTFLRGLNKSLNEARQNKLFKINSLKDLK